jgi:hypothetical protein
MTMQCVYFNIWTCLLVIHSAPQPFHQVLHYARTVLLRSCSQKKTCIQIGIMYSVCNIFVAIAPMCVVPFSLGAPAPTQADTIASHRISQFNRNSTGHEINAIDALSRLEAVAINCGVTSRPGHDCAQNMCPPDEQCKVSDAGNCVFTNPANKRPVGCRYYKCYTTSM